MRKIEQLMVAAVLARATTTVGNTTICTADDLTSVYLHGHMIAQVFHGRGSLLVSLAGWNTNTTRSRLSALIRGLAQARADSLPPMTAAEVEADAAGPYRHPAGLGVSSRKGVPRIHDARGETVIDTTGFWTVEL